MIFYWNFFYGFFFKNIVFSVRVKSTRKIVILVAGRVFQNILIINNLVLFQKVFWGLLSTTLSMNNARINYFHFLKMFIGITQKSSHFIWLYQVINPSRSYHGKSFGTNFGNSYSRIHFLSFLIFLLKHLILLKEIYWFHQ